MKKRLFCVILTILLLLCGCGKDDPDPTDDPKQTTEADEQDETEKPGGDETGEGDTTGAQEDETESGDPDAQVYWVWAEGGLNVRSGPGKSYEAVGYVEDGDEIIPLKWENGWAYIEAEYKGWVSGDYIHKLGWYKDVKTPEPSKPQDTSMAGKWLHLTTPASSGGETRTRAGVITLNKDGTFSHTVADYKKTDKGWALLTPGDKQVFWVGEYNYDGKILQLNYMARLNGREWIESKYELILEPKAGEDGHVFISHGEHIPVTASMGFNANTVDELYKVKKSAVATLDAWYTD